MLLYNHSRYWKEKEKNSDSPNSHVSKLFNRSQYTKMEPVSNIIILKGLIPAEAHSGKRTFLL